MVSAGLVEDASSTTVAAFPSGLQRAAASTDDDDDYVEKLAFFFSRFHPLDDESMPKMQSMIDKAAHQKALAMMASKGGGKTKTAPIFDKRRGGRGDRKGRKGDRKGDGKGKRKGDRKGDADDADDGAGTKTDSRQVPAAEMTMIREAMKKPHKKDVKYCFQYNSSIGCTKQNCFEHRCIKCGEEHALVGAH